MSFGFLKRFKRAEPTSDEGLETDKELAEFYAGIFERVETLEQSYVNLAKKVEAVRRKVYREEGAAPLPESIPDNGNPPPIDKIAILNALRPGDPMPPGI